MLEEEARRGSRTLHSVNVRVVVPGTGVGGAKYHDEFSGTESTYSLEVPRHIDVFTMTFSSQEFSPFSRQTTNRRHHASPQIDTHTRIFSHPSVPNKNTGSSIPETMVQHAQIDENSPLLERHFSTEYGDSPWKRSTTRTKIVQWCPRYQAWRALTLIGFSIGIVGLIVVTIHRNHSLGWENTWSFPTNNNNTFRKKRSSTILPPPNTTVAFVGNSMFYFNDFPRFFVELTGGRIWQDSCLHGGASIASLVKEGNGMYPQFQTDNALIEIRSSDPNRSIYDYGACTVQQLLTGQDDRLDDPGYAISEDAVKANHYNPCRVNPEYLRYATEHVTRKQWDFVLINDNTRNPARAATRALGLQTLELFHVPWILQSGAIPVFLATHAYHVDANTSALNMTGLDDIAQFTSLTYAGYRAYSRLLQGLLPPHQQPRIAPVGLAFLLVHEERYDMWLQLFHSDHLHASPSGTFLQGCIIYHTLFGTLPPSHKHRRTLLPCGIRHA